jgi:hypothetical protein
LLHEQNATRDRHRATLELVEALEHTDADGPRLEIDGATESERLFCFSTKAVGRGRSLRRSTFFCGWYSIRSTERSGANRIKSAAARATSVPRSKQFGTGSESTPEQPGESHDDPV